MDRIAAKTIKARIPETLHERWDRAAQANGLDKAEIVRMALRVALRQGKVSFVAERKKYETATISQCHEIRLTPDIVAQIPEGKELNSAAVIKALDEYLTLRPLPSIDGRLRQLAAKAIQIEERREALIFATPENIETMDPI